MKYIFLALFTSWVVWAGSNTPTVIRDATDPAYQATVNSDGSFNVNILSGGGGGGCTPSPAPSIIEIASLPTPLPFIQISPSPVPTNLSMNITAFPSPLPTFNMVIANPITASAPIVATPGIFPNISCNVASGSQAGCLSSTDWNTFNNKAPFPAPTPTPSGYPLVANGSAYVPTLLSVGGGGTGSSSFTTGSIPYSNGTSLTQDNANFQWVDSSTALEIGPMGANTPDATLEAYAGSLGTATAHFHNNGPPSSTGGAIVNLNAIPTATPTPLPSNSRLGSFQYAGSYDTSQTPGVGAAINATTTQAWSASALGTQLTFNTVPNNSTARTTALTLGQDQSATFAGKVTMGTPLAITSGGTGASTYYPNPTPSPSGSYVQATGTGYQLANPNPYPVPTPSPSGQPLVANGSGSWVSQVLGVIGGGTGLSTAGTAGQVLGISGTSPAWVSPLQSAMLTSPELFDDFHAQYALGDTYWYPAYSGTGAAFVNLPGTASHPGLVQLQTGTTTTGRSAAVKNMNSVGSAGDILPGGGVITAEFILRVPTLSNGTDTFYVTAGLGDYVIGVNNGYVFQYNYTANGNYWQVGTIYATFANWVVLNGTSGNPTLAVNAGDWLHGKIVVNAANNSVVFSAGLNGAALTTMATITYPGATYAFTTHPVSGNFQIVKTAGTTSEGVDIDMWYQRVDLTTAR